MTATTSSSGDRDKKFRLYESSELSEGWDPTQCERLTVWKATQRLAAALESSESDVYAREQNADRVMNPRRHSNSG